MVTPREQMAKYSTQLTYSTDTSPTFLSILQQIDAVYPNQSASTDKIRWINDTLKDVWKYCASTRLYSSTTVAEQALYPLSTDMRFDKISSVFVSDSTARSSTEEYTEYIPAGQDDVLSGNQYYKAGGGIGIYPVPTTDDAGYAIKVIYEAIPPVYASTTDTTTVPRINVDYAEVLKWRPLREVAGAGNNPDVEMRNNFDAEYRNVVKKMRMDYYKQKAKSTKEKYPRNSHWWNG